MKIISSKNFINIKRGDLITIDYGYIEQEAIFLCIEKLDKENMRIKYNKENSRYFIKFKTIFFNEYSDKIILKNMKIIIQ